MRIVCWSRMEAVDWSRMDAVDWSTFNPGRASGNITSVSASIPCTSGSDLRLLKKCSGRAAAGARTRWMSWLSCERRSVSPWRLTISWISLDEQRRTNSPSSWAALAWGIPNTPASPSSHARICRSTLRFTSHLHPMHHACKTNLPVDGIASAQSLPLPPEWGLFRRCCALSCLSPYGPAERHRNLLAGLAHRYVKPQVFGRRIFHLEFPQRVAHRLRENLFP